MELRQLRYFTAVADALNFTEASRRLFITQGTLSQQLRQLEFELGSDLFTRSSHNVSLTEAGEILLPLAREIVERAESCKTKMKDLRAGVSGELRIGASNSMKRLVSTAARKFLDRYPGVALQICCNSAHDLLRMLREREIDVIVSFCRQHADPDLSTRILYPTRLSAVMSKGHCLSETGSLSIQEITRYQTILPGGGLQARKLFEEFFAIDMGDIKPCATVNDIDIILAILRGTSRIAILSSADIHDREGFVAVPIKLGDGAESSGRDMVCCAQHLKDSYRKRSALAFEEILGECADIERICMEM